MTKNKLNINLWLPIITLIFSAGISCGIVSSKVQDVDKTKEKCDILDSRVTRVEANIENIKESLKEQRSDTKEIIKLLKK